MKKIKYEEVKKNKRLTDFDGIKEMVISNYIKPCPPIVSDGKKDNSKQTWFSNK